jgi:predicted metal-dependent phosphoesterase TrpH
MPKTRLDILNNLLEDSSGTTWHKVNLHTHASGQDPEKVVDAAIGAGLSLIAVTDHNTFKFVKPVQDAAKKRVDGNLVVLPGIEITLEEGAHIIAIFDIDFDETGAFLGQCLNLDLHYTTGRNGVDI